MTILLNVSSLKRLLIPAAVCLFLPSSVRAQESAWSGPRYNARDVTLKIEVGQSTYRVGDSINVRVTLRNSTGNPIAYTATGPTALAELRVFDAAGRPVEPTVIGPINFTHGWQQEIEAHGEKALYDNAKHEWMNLRDWGYDLRTPGTYTIVGFPGLSGPRLTPDTTIRSNRVEITLKR